MSAVSGRGIRSTTADVSRIMETIQQIQKRINLSWPGKSSTYKIVYPDADTGASVISSFFHTGSYMGAHVQAVTVLLIEADQDKEHVPR